jgi:hypothetical protein
MDLERLKGKCGVCLQELAGEVLTYCTQCKSYYHPECWKFNGKKCAVYGCWKSPFPKRRIGPPQRHADVFNPYVMAALILLTLAVFAWNYIRFISL